MKVLLISMVILLAGCAQWRAAIGSYGAEAAEATLHDAEWMLCSAVPVGAVKKRYNTARKMTVYAELCGDTELIP